MNPFNCTFIKGLAACFAATAAIAHAAPEPRTLLDYAAARREPARLGEAVLVIVDAQREYVDGKLPLSGVDDAVGAIARLLARARTAGTPVVHVVQHGRPGGAIMDPQGPMVNVIAPLAPLPGETVIVKSLPSGFAGTGLAAELTRLGRQELIVVGFMSHMCVSTTVRAALEHGYRCTVVADACATRDLPDGHGGVVTAAEVQRVELVALADRFAVVVPTQKALRD